MDSELENSKENKEKHSMWQSQEARKHGNGAGRGVMKRTGTNKAHFSIVRHQERVVYTFFSQSLSTKRYQNADNFPQTDRKRSSSLSCGFLILDSMVKNSMSGHP